MLNEQKKLTEHIKDGILYGMSLPIGINELLSGQVIEWERLEFKKGWNPEAIIRSICAFANDINNLGSGYVVVGIEEKNGQPQLPPVGIDPKEIDGYQKKIIELGHKIKPKYFPVIEPVVFKDKHILVIWVPGGDDRPYKAPTTLKKEKSLHEIYIRRGSVTKIADTKETKQLAEISATVPFDDRKNYQASLQDLKLNLIESFLADVNSQLRSQVHELPFESLCKQLNIVKGPDEDLRPINAGLLLFSSDPEKFFPGSRIEIVTYHDEIGDNFSEKSFSGPMHVQLKNALLYIKNTVIEEQVKKVPDKAEARRFYNYPFEAIEEALANAVYHRDYSVREPVEVQIRSDNIAILSYPGPLPPLDNQALKKSHVLARLYRNRRLGDFLKELHLTEGRATGIPKMRNALKQNGSPEPKFETDGDRYYFLCQIYIHPEFKSLVGGAKVGASRISDLEISDFVPSLSQVCPK